MRVEATSIAGCWIFSPQLHLDDRGVFLESFTSKSFRHTLGHELQVRQTNVSCSRQGTLRGIHFADVPPGQAKYVQCSAGKIMDIVVDIRVGSATFGLWEAVELNSDARRALYLAEGLGHAFCALSETATVSYMCSEPYTPAREHGIHPLDPDLGITWPRQFQLHLSAKDSEAPSLAEALSLGLLPTYEECKQQYRSLRDRDHS